jgi:hypothetical protein
VSAVIATAEQPLRSQIDRVEAKLGGLSQDLRFVEGELSKLAPQREQYGLVQNVCESLERLRELGVASMFWGETTDAREADRHVDEVRQRLGVFTEQVKVVEDKRQALLEDIKHGQEVLHLLEGDLFEVLEEEDEKRREWVVEREIGPLDERPQRMPWSRFGEDEERFRKNLLTTLMIALVAGVVTPLIPMPAPEPEEVLELPERVVRFIDLSQRRPLPALPPVVEQPKPEEPEPTQEPVVANVETPAAPPPVEAPAPAPEVAPRQRAEAAGLLAFRQSFADIAERRPAAQIGSAARVSNSSAGDGRLPTRALVTSLAPGSSGGINLASFSRDVGGDGGGGGSLEGVEVGRVTSNIGEGPGGPGGAAGTGDHAWAGGLAGRTDEEIQIVFDRYKAALYRLYNRELRNDPSLRGQMVLKLTIEPSGAVSFLELQSTDMNAPALVTQVLERVRTFDFGAKDVAAITIVYPIDFLPAA